MKHLAMAAALLLAVSVAAAGAETAEPGSMFRELQPLEGTRFQKAWAVPGLDFSRYGRIAILEPHVAFKKDWAKRHRGMSQAEIDTIKRDVAVVLKEKFEEVFGAAGMDVVTISAKDVLVIRPALLDLDVYAPAGGFTGATRAWSPRAGAVTLYVELMDSTSGKLLARFVDRGSGPSELAFWPSAVNMLAEMRELLGNWAVILRDWIRGGGTAQKTD
jgi:hypothetical protein